MVLTLSGLKLPEDQINRFMMWKSPDMQSYYINQRDTMLKLAPANVISILSDRRIEEIQQDLIWKTQWFTPMLPHYLHYSFYDFKTYSHSS